MPIVEIGIFCIVLAYLWAGKELIMPMGWYFGFPIERTWWKDIIFLAFALALIVLWLPIIVIGVSAYIYK